VQAIALGTQQGAGGRADFEVGGNRFLVEPVGLAGQLDFPCSGLSDTQSRVP
jgi:hypothetical protein